MNVLEATKNEVKALNFKNVKEVLDTMPKFIEGICIDIGYDHEMFSNIFTILDR